MTSSPGEPDACPSGGTDHAEQGRRGSVLVTTGGLVTRTGLAAWVLRVAPELALTAVRVWLDPRESVARIRGRSRTAEALQVALSAIPTAATELSDLTWPPQMLPTLLRTIRSPRLRVARSVSYGPEPEQVLDVWRDEAVDVGASQAPVLIFVPGGGWVHGRSAGQGHALLGRLAARGWICIALSYRVAPANPWPAHIEDVKRAVAWTRENVEVYGGSNEFVAIAGASAGGHLAALVGLTASSGRWQRGFEEADSHVDAVVGLYGRYDWESRTGAERQRFMRFLERVVVGARQEVAASVFTDASPLAQVQPDAPPFFVAHGSHDAIIPVEQARQFAEELAKVSTAPVVYAELPGAGHVFDVMDPWRGAVMARAVERFLDRVRDSAKEIG